MAVTMRDVGRRAGVSAKTVSNVINGYPYIRPATRDRVLEAIAELGYRMNTSARSLRTGRRGTIALALPELRVPYFAELASEVIHAAEARGLTVIIEQHGGRRDLELDVLTGSRRDLTDGLIYSPLALGPGDEALLDVPYPIVLLGERIFHPNLDHVTMQNTAAAKAATEHLLAQGRRRIVAMGPNPDQDVGSAPLRFAGYQAAVEEAGIAVDPALAVPTKRSWDHATGARTIGRLVDDGVDFDAVFAFNDSLALGAMHELQARGRRIPDDVAVIGFDAIDEGRYSNPTLTTIDPGRAQIPRDAVRLIDERQRGVAGDPCRVAPEFRLVPGGSTGAEELAARGARA
ncbi:LacI family DNA-binding transcriptional regulator [Cellulomonas terrae]|uniref:LacI family transcriptional regulator n=1 Tax=Cellulomonas terrae TaxID=311234 RepID=A0A511JK79_9CELL|nr:LacI family DNA-binding transcriptional regulator [Cellulomonas terrae]GEL98356.1 LacI family transcriptional regulator [Cellulomonas terrae]